MTFRRHNTGKKRGEPLLCLSRLTVDDLEAARQPKKGLWWKEQKEVTLSKLLR
jgi:hypothetical protein